MNAKNEKKASAKKVAARLIHKDYGNDPFFVQKAAASKKVIEKYGLPKQLLSENKNGL